MTELTQIEEQDHVVVITMDDGKANALGFSMIEALNAGLDRAEQTGKVVVLAGRPGKFSAGFDLTVMGGGGSAMTELLQNGANLALRLLTFPTPVVLAVSGHALAMGALLCLSADYRIGIEGNYKVGLNEVAIGMTLPWFGVELARARLDNKALEAAVSLARIYSPTEAATVGYLDQTVAEADLMATATALAAQLASLDMKAHRETKVRTRAALLTQLEAGMAKDFAPISRDEPQ